MFLSGFRAGLWQVEGKSNKWRMQMTVVYFFWYQVRQPKDLGAAASKDWGKNKRLHKRIHSS